MLHDTGYRFKKSLGQHFLKSEKVLDDIVAAAQIKKEDTIFEIGSGTGNLTKKLLASPAREIIAVEKDDVLFAQLQNTFKSQRLKLIHSDALVLIPDLVAESPLKVVANLPYNIASPAIISLLSVCPTLPEIMVIMLQKEVAERLVAQPGDSNRGLLTVFLELFGEAKIVERVNKGCFRPIPEVDSAVVKIAIRPCAEDSPSQDEITGLFQRTVLCTELAKHALRILKAAFGAKRKKIRNSLFKSYVISSLPAGEAGDSEKSRHFTLQEASKIAEKCGFSLDQRPEELTRDQWLKLIHTLSSSSRM